MKIYTKTGDSGKTSLFNGSIVWKDDLRIDAYGTIDELNSMIGLAHTEIDNIEIKETLIDIQFDLFIAGADLASPNDPDKKQTLQRIIENDFRKLESKIDYFDSKLPTLKNFIIPGGSKGSSILHLARTICRRAERQVVTLGNKAEIGKDIIIYLNRLSDLLFVLARYENMVNATPDIIWKTRG
ncbi:MAG: cob(I)yrinic acid a,c-diamide adenosyltransferase [bacterium]